MLFLYTSLDKNAARLVSEQSEAIHSLTGEKVVILLPEVSLDVHTPIAIDVFAMISKFDMRGRNFNTISSIISTNYGLNLSDLPCFLFFDSFEGACLDCFAYSIRDSAFSEEILKNIISDMCSAWRQPTHKEYLDLPSFRRSIIAEIKLKLKCRDFGKFINSIPIIKIITFLLGVVLK